MRTSLVRLPARPATSILVHGAGSVQQHHHHRLKSYKIEERGIELKEKHRDAVNRFVRKVRLRARKEAAPTSANEGTKQEHDHEKDGEQRATRQQQQGESKIEQEQRTARSRQFRKVKVGHNVPQYASERSIELPRVRTVLTLDPPIRTTYPKLTFLDHIEETLGRELDQDDAVQERDKWGKSPEIWLSLLRREARLKGHVGVEQVWTLIKEAEVELPIKTAKAGQFWTTLLSVPKLHDDVIAYAIQMYARTGRAFAPLYTLMVGYFLREGSPEKTLNWHRRFLDNYIVPKDALQKLAIPASISRTNASLEAFRTIYEDLYKMCHPCYDQLIPALLRVGRFRQALRWHNILGKNNDNPSSDVARTESMRVFLHLRQSMQEKRGATLRRLRVRELDREARSTVFIKSASTLPTTSSNEEQHAEPESSSLEQAYEPPALDSSFFTPPAPVSASAVKKLEKAASASTSSASKRGLFSSLFAEVQNSGQEGFSDEFCARLYATRAVTVSWVTSFLHAFSVKKVGTLTIRELALRCQSTEELQYHISDLKHKGISLGSSTFCRVIKKCAEDGQVELLRGLLRSDQHPDNLDNKEMQQTMLDEAVARQDGPAIHHTLTLMTMFARNPKQEYMNGLMCSYIEQRRISDVLRQANEMQFENVKITQKTIKTAMMKLLRPRLPGKRPNMLDGRFSYDDLKIVTNLVIRALEAGTEIPTSALVELFKRHGMKNLDSVERFCHAIIEAYQSIMAKPTYDQRARAKGFISLSSLPGARPPSEHAIRASLPFTNPANPLHPLFTPRRLQFIIAWGFHEGLRRLAIARDKYQRPRSRPSPGLTKYRRWPAGVPPPPPQQTVLRGVDVVQGLGGKGVNVVNSATEAALRQRLWILFGPGRSKKRRNATAMALNPYGIVELLRAVDGMWKGPKPLFAPVRDMLLPLPSGSTAAHQDDQPVRTEESKWEEFETELPAHELTTASSLPVSTHIHDQTELQLRMHTEALVRIFWSCRVGGLGGDHKRREKKLLARDTRDDMLYSWARQSAMKRFSP